MQQSEEILQNVFFSFFLSHLRIFLMYIFKNFELVPIAIMKYSYLNPEDIRAYFFTFTVEHNFCSSRWSLTCQNRGTVLMLRLEVTTQISSMKALVSKGYLISVVLSYPPHKGKAASASREREMQSRVFKIRLSWSNIH